MTEELLMRQRDVARERATARGREVVQLRHQLDLSRTRYAALRAEVKGLREFKRWATGVGR